MTSRSRLKGVLFSAIIVVFFFVLVEVMLRATTFGCDLPEPNLCSFGNVSYRFNTTSGGGDLVPNQDGVWAIWPHRPYHVQTNSDGLRNAKEVNHEADFTILAVGDSFTFGPYVPNENTWPAWLEFMLAGKLTTRRSVQVLNAGVAGYTIQDEYYYLVERGLSLQPDLVVIAIYPNDISDFAGEQRGFLARPQKMIRGPSLVSMARRVFERYESKLAILRLATRIKRSAEVVEAREDVAASSAEQHEDKKCSPYVAPDVIENDPCWRSFDEWLERTISLLKDNDIALLLVAIPDQRQLDLQVSATMPQRFLSKIASREDVAFLDLLPSLDEGSSSEALYLQRIDPNSGEYVGNAHMSSEGYRRVARRIAEEIGRRWLVSHPWAGDRVR
jgi:lysophospholipase L1-like esterase